MSIEEPSFETVTLNDLERMNGTDRDALPFGVVGIGADTIVRVYNATEARMSGLDPSTVIGADDQVLIPRGSSKTDWEVELAIVIGRTARYCDSEDEAAACIAGYTLAHDVSEREFQLERGGQWDKGKSCETFNPLGPWLVTPDELDPADVALQLRVNGELRQDGTTKNMVFRPAEIVRYLSQFMVLHPGDVINTGTPAGVALGGCAPYLRVGDVVELTGSGLGAQRQRIGAA